MGYLKYRTTNKRGITDFRWLSYFHVNDLITPCKGIYDGLGFWIPSRGDRIPGLCQQNLYSEFQLMVGFGFLLLYSGFHCPGFRIPQAKISPFPDSTSTNFPDSLTLADEGSRVTPSRILGENVNVDVRHKLLIFLFCVKRIR